MLGAPPDLDQDAVLQQKPLAYQIASALQDVDEIPVQSRLETSGQAGGDIGGQHGSREEHRVVAARPDNVLEDVDARLRKGRIERIVLCDVHVRGPESA